MKIKDRKILHFTEILTFKDFLYMPILNFCYSRYMGCVYYIVQGDVNPPGPAGRALPLFFNLCSEKYSQSFKSVYSEGPYHSGNSSHRPDIVYGSRAILCPSVVSLGQRFVMIFILVP